MGDSEARGALRGTERDGGLVERHLREARALQRLQTKMGRTNRTCGGCEIRAEGVERRAEGVETRAIRSASDPPAIVTRVGEAVGDAGSVPVAADSSSRTRRCRASSWARVV